MSMAGRNNHTLTNCTAAGIQCSSQMVCPVNVDTTFHKSMRGPIWRVNTLQLAEAILAGLIVGIGAYGQRYRHHPITRFIFLGATTLFLPIISSVVSTVSAHPTYSMPLPIVPYFTLNHELSVWVAKCNAFDHSVFLVVLPTFVQIVMINTSTLVVVDDREGQSKGPPFELLVQGLWTLYLGLNFLEQDTSFGLMIQIIPFGLLSSKIVLKYYAFGKARRSFAIGRNPGLIAVHMHKIKVHEANQNTQTPMGEEPPPPPLLVMGEEQRQVEMQPHGYAFKDYSVTTMSINNNGLITIDRVWQLDAELPIPTPQIKDLCLSFALFKLLRCRFARYKLTNAGSMGSLVFFRSLVLKAGEQDRVFGLVANELSFLHDYYYSSLPISYSQCCLPVLSIFLSLLTIGYCILFLMLAIYLLFIVLKHSRGQLGCMVWCIHQGLVSSGSYTYIGRSYLDLVPLIFLLVLVVAAEVRDMASYICSNWTKVTLICRYVNRASSQHSLSMQKWVSLLLRCRCKLMKHWDGKMSQCSVLVVPPRTSSLLVLVRRLLRLPDQRRKVKVPAGVNVSIVNALRTIIINGILSNGVRSLRRSQVGESFIWACDGKGTSDTILLWHIATCILEVRHPYRHDQEQGPPTISNNSDHKIAATHLSRYCAYLVTWSPELLPDNVAWSKSLYKAVKEDAEHALAGHPAARSPTPVVDYQQLVETLSANSQHEVLNNGVQLGKQLVETIEEEETAWKLLADFWSEMILYVAPSDNLKGHKEAIARGGELITLLWVMLFHAGIVSRPGEEDGASAATTSASSV